MTRLLLVLPGLVLVNCLQAAEPLAQEPNTWVKRSPLKTAPTSPGLGYEASLVYDPFHRRIIRWGGHNQGGGGEQNAETWTLEPVSMRWELKEPNRAPPGVCCAQQNVFDLAGGRFLRFPAFSGSHGWHWFRENYLNNTSVWSYDLGTNTWRDMRPAPAPHVVPLRCAAWDSEFQVAVVFGGEGSNEGTLVYDPYDNTWARMRPKPEPPGRSGGNMAYDAARRLHILFGSQFTDDPHTWGYDLAKNEWRDLKPAMQPPTRRNNAVLAYAAAHQVVVAVVLVPDQEKGDQIVSGHLETWAYDAGKNTWTAMKPPREPEGWSSRGRIMTAIPDQQLLLMEADVVPTPRIPGVGREQQIWTYRYGPVRRSPAPAPAGVAVSTMAGGKAIVSWQPVDGAKAYLVYRAEGALPWKAEPKLIATVTAPQKSFADDGLTAGKVYHYRVRAVDAAAKEGEASLAVRAQPRLVEDAVVSVVSPREVRLSWTPPAGSDIVGYHVERAAVEVFSEDEVLRLKKDTTPLAEPSVGAVRMIGTFVRLTKEPLRTAAYTDTSIDLTRLPPLEGEPIFRHRFRGDQLDPRGKPYRFAVHAYRIRALNALGVEGGPSPYFLTIPAAPQGLFAREEGASCHLKWSSNAEAGLGGYRVYRMEGPRVNGPGQTVTRLTSEPQAATQYIDHDVGKETHRYWVVAVDSLGQEGIPSAPAWHYRQYRKYYEPFTGDWHQ